MLELKREVPSGDAANRELATDLASLAVDGGLTIIGVDEGTSPGTVAGAARGTGLGESSRWLGPE